MQKKIINYIIILLTIFILGISNSINSLAYVTPTTIFQNSWGGGGVQYYQVSPDGKYLFYINPDNYNLIRRSLIDGSEMLMSSYSNSYNFVVSSDSNYLFYTKYNDGNKLYKKSINDSSVGSVVPGNLSFTYYETIRSSGNYIYYTNNSDNGRIYKKDINDNTIGNPITPDTGSISVRFTFSPDGQYIVYSNRNDGWRLYIKSVNDNSMGNPITNSTSGYSYTTTNSLPVFFSRDGQYVYYINNNDGYKIYKTSIHNTSDGIVVVNAKTYPINTPFNDYNVYPFYIPSDESYIIYINGDDGKLYKKSLYDTSSQGTLFTNYGATSGLMYSPTNSRYLVFTTGDSMMDGRSMYTIDIQQPNGDINNNNGTYILNQLDGSKGNMQFLNNSSLSTAFSNYSQVKSNFLANYSYMQTWYEAKGLTTDVINNNVDWNNGVIFSKTDVAGGMLDGYKLSARYPFSTNKETDNDNSSITWRYNLSNTSFQTDTIWTNVGIPAYPIRNGSGGIVAYLQFPCGNLICKDQYCSDVKKIVNPAPINPINETVFSDPGNGLPYCGDNIKNTMDEECDGNDGIKHDLGETCSAQCKVQTSPGVTPGCPSYSALGFSCNGSVSTPIFVSAPANQPPVPTYSGFGVDKNTMKSDNLTATDNENDTLTFVKFSDPAHGTVNVLENGSFTYTPSLNYIGNDSFFYSVSDGTNGAVTQEVTIVVNDVVVGNNPPIPTFSSLSVNQGSVYSDVLTATDTENDVLSYLSAVNPLHGTLNINSNGSFDYTPNVDYNGIDTFTYAVSDSHNLPVEKVVTITVNGVGNSSSGSIINWTPPGSITLPVIGDINVNTGMTDTEETISDDVVCSSTDNGISLNKSIIVTNTMADTTFLTGLKGKTEFIKTLSGSSTEVAEKIVQKKLKAEKLNEKSSTYDLGAGGNISGIQFNLTKIPNSAIMRKLVDLAIDHSSTTMADYEQIIVDSCNGTITSTGTMVVPAGFVDVNEKGETILNLFRFNG